MNPHWDVVGTRRDRNGNIFPSIFPGSCDSYVKVRLLPEEKFTDVKLPKTHVQKENLYPLYDEIFNM